MLKVTCTQRFRDKHNNIIGYQIKDKDGNVKNVTAESLKSAIRREIVAVDNLVLTSDNRLVRAAENRSHKAPTSNKNLNTYAEDTSGYVGGVIDKDYKGYPLFIPL